MEAHSCGGELMPFKLCLPKNKVYLHYLHMNRYPVPSSISIIGRGSGCMLWSLVRCIDGYQFYCENASIFDISM